MLASRLLLGVEVPVDTGHSQAGANGSQAEDRAPGEGTTAGSDAAIRRRRDPTRLLVSVLLQPLLARDDLHAVRRAVRAAWGILADHATPARARRR